MLHTAFWPWWCSDVQARTLWGPMSDGRVKSRQGRISVTVTKFPPVHTCALVCDFVSRHDFMCAWAREGERLRRTKRNQSLSLKRCSRWLGSTHTHTQRHMRTHKQRGSGCIIHRVIKGRQKPQSLSLWAHQDAVWHEHTHTHTHTHSSSPYWSEQWFSPARQQSTEGNREKRRWIRGNDGGRERIIFQTAPSLPSSA